MTAAIHTTQYSDSALVLRVTHKKAEQSLGFLHNHQNLFNLNTFSTIALIKMRSKY
jgi:hypothetical protein